ncbi:MAG: glycosyltransferase family 2 protein [Proteobacteria bacterium]|nr:glycosyltransferase family 2 protein [Pseudomonadota bacterium]MCP4917314.1 glycosyltransferase family 2 protein [Pseudomonadota bacterium]
MALPTGFRPRTETERLRMARAMQCNSTQVPVSDADGWESLHVRVAGKIPVWEGGDSPTLGSERADAVLSRFGFPTLDDAALVSRRTEGPLVSIVICTYNRFGLLTEAISTALAQTWPCEVIVVDDGSTDSTADVLSRIDGIQVITLAENQGKPAALKAGVAAARGEYLLIFDDDDLLFPGSVQVLAMALGEDPELVGVFGDSLRFRDGDVFEVRPASRVDRHTMRSAVLAQVPGLTGAFLCRTQAWHDIGGVDPELTRGEDMDLFLRFTRHGPVESIPVATFVNRVHGGLRGHSSARWSKKDEARHQRITLGYIAPVFRKRWQELAMTCDRDEGHAWALGLLQRGLRDEATIELDRWPGPFNERESWIRQRCGLPSRRSMSEGAVVVVDEGDPGALEACLAKVPRELQLYVALETAREPIGDLQLHWPGLYALQVDLGSLLAEAAGPWHLRLASSPDWAPPPLEDLSWLAPLAPIDAVLCAAAAQGWTLPSRGRLGLHEPLDPRTRAALSVRRLLDRGEPGRALAISSHLLESMSSWPGAWVLAAECFEQLGATQEAAQCRQRLRAS